MFINEAKGDLVMIQTLLLFKSINVNCLVIGSFVLQHDVSFFSQRCILNSEKSKDCSVKLHLEM